MRYLPNCITCLRIVFTLLLPFFAPLSLPFLALYALCGLSDVLDGYLARKLQATSALGARLDSLADLLMIAMLLWRIFPVLQLPLWMLCWIAAIAGVRFLAFFVCRIRYHQFASLHTLSNKATGLLLFLFPFCFRFFGLFPCGVLLCAVASLSALEELLIQLSSKKLSLDVKSIFSSENPHG